MFPADVAPEKQDGGCCDPTGGRTVHKAKPPLDRNRDIVNGSDVMLVAPRERKEELRSGTWATYRYAREQGKTCIVVWP